MTLPRQIIPNATYLVTRRCSQRQFLLIPTQQTKQIFTYCMATAAENTGVVIHAVTVLSNHYHAVVTDVEGRLPEFLEHLHKFVAKAVNAGLGRWENLWSSEKPSAVILSEAQDVIDKTLYTVCNPVEAGLVAKYENWPGLLAFLPGQSINVDRPKIFFKEDGKMPKSAVLTIQKPPQVDKLTNREWSEQIQKSASEKQQLIQIKMNQKGRSFMGVRAVLQQNPYDRPKSTEPRRRLSPKVAAKSKKQRIEAILRLKAFIAAYKEAQDALFPQGTYYLRIHANVICASG